MEQFNRLRFTGVVLALAGALILTLQKTVAPGPSQFWFYAVLSLPIILAVGNIYRTAKWPEHETPQSLAPGMLVAAALMLFAGGLTASQSVTVPFNNTSAVRLIAIQTLIFTAQYYLYFLLQKHGGPILLSFTGGVSALVGIPIAVLVLREDIPAGLSIAAVLIIGGIILTSHRPSPKVNPKQKVTPL